MFGGVAQTYCKWKLDGEPYKKGNALYVKVVHPLTKSLKEVRFYTDKKHADLMPVEANKYGPFWALFGFDNQEDYIYCIKEKDISLEEKESYFSRNWRFGMFFGGVWYAPKTKELPPIKNKNKIFKATWLEFRAAGQAHSRELNMVPESESPWFK